MPKDEGNGTRHLVLVVDDEEGIRKVLQRQLTQLGYQVALAVDGTEALALAERFEPAAIITDVHMPGMDGHSLLRRLNPLGLQSSVILMSGQGELDDAISALRQGAVDYLKKPWTLDELAAAVQRATELFDALEDLSAPVTAAPTNGHGRAANEGRVDAAKLISELAARGDAMGMPAVPPAIAWVRELAAREDAEVDDRLLAILERDPVLVASVFQVAEEKPGTHVIEQGDLRAAAQAIGVRAVRSQVETAAVREAFPIGVPALRTLNERIRGFAVSRALAMQGIAEIADRDVQLDAEECYLAGLWLDVGAMYLLSAISDALQQHGGGIADLARMTEAIATHHSAVGASILRRWGMPRTLVELTGGHHLDALAPNAPPLWCASALGTAVAVRIAGFGDPTGDRELKPELLARCAYTLGVGDTSLRRLTRSLNHHNGHADAVV
jgi:CheY-like chemotaxis protein/HD-like signal output (HDOD) protein